MKSLVLLFSLLMGLHALAGDGVNCSGKDIKVNVALSDIEGQPAKVAITHVTSKGDISTVVLKNMVVRYGIHSRHFVDAGFETKLEGRVPERSDQKTPRDIAEKMSFAFYHHTARAEQYEGDNDTFLVMNGKTYDLDCFQ